MVWYTNMTLYCDEEISHSYNIMFIIWCCKKKNPWRFLSRNDLYFYTDKLLKTKYDPLNKSILQNIPAQYICTVL